MKSAAIAVLFLGLGGTMAQMLQFKNGSFSTQGTMMMIGSLAIGGLIGEWLRIEDRFTEFGNWLKQKTGNATIKNSSKLRNSFFNRLHWRDGNRRRD